jgi:hypothetical protein
MVPGLDLTMQPMVIPYPTGNVMITQKVNWMAPYYLTYIQNMILFLGACKADLHFPYDTDPEFLKMLSRNDLKEVGFMFSKFEYIYTL